ncbi:adenylate kinase [Dunaliella salina]|uniref:adenylate kinase n=1 Tax=Dunaliella salina TaxID=3046 RepID=A0ABQ7G395_DUNSA|nr:adenylate kinase [Dunaliella salina]|eukprot:KAF5829070.1 adenylate kinase [Dunaliella salina]
MSLSWGISRVFPLAASLRCASSQLQAASQLQHQSFGCGVSPSCSFGTDSQQTGPNPPLRAVFLGPPGVGKGTYASRIASHFGLPHIATGDLIREEIKTKTDMGLQIQNIVSKGQLVPDPIIFDLLHRRLSQESSSGNEDTVGFVLDGFPRTREQAQAVVSTMRINLALNLVLREEVLVEKCLGRRVCTHCGTNYNIADIHLPADPGAGRPAIVMPPLSPPPQCAPHLEVRADDTEEVIRHRLQVYKDQAAPVEEVFREAGLLHSYELTQGIPQTLPRLLEFVQPFCGHADHQRETPGSDGMGGKKASVASAAAV